MYIPMRSALLQAAALAGAMLLAAEGRSVTIPIRVMECAGEHAAGFPASAVVPLPRGLSTNTGAFALRGEDGGALPVQCEVLVRWPGDGSLRHLLVHFQPDLPAWSNRVVTLEDGAPLLPTQAVTVAETASNIMITTGPLQCIVSKQRGTLLESVWLDQDGDGQFAESEAIISPGPGRGGQLTPLDFAGPVQRDADRTNLAVTVEESGPLRAVIRLEEPAVFLATNDHRHGFAARLYAYAGQPFLKIDYQLQNSAKNAARSWPLYFKDMRVSFPLNLDTGAVVRTGIGRAVPFTATNRYGIFQAQESHSAMTVRRGSDGAVLYATNFPNGAGAEGVLDVRDGRRGVAIMLRLFWETWPNGLGVDTQNVVSLQLFPSWSRQFFQHSAAEPPQFGTNAFFWLEDMQHVVKEGLLYFHGAGTADADLLALARTFQRPPVALADRGWQRGAAATLDLGGVLPPETNLPAPAGRRVPEYDAAAFTGTSYNFNWAIFRDPEPSYRRGASTPGGWAYSGAHGLASGDAADYFADQDQALAELNVRPEWIANYRHDEDWPLLRLTENPYGGGCWRIFEGHGVSALAATRLPGASVEDEGEAPVYYARDDQHGWFYHVADAYLTSGNPWIRDWYRFVGEFRRVRLERLDPFPDTSSRATAHSLQHALQAYRVTGDTNLLARLGAHVRDYLRPDQDPYYGDQKESVEPAGGGFQTGYLMRFLADYLEEVADSDPQGYAEGFQYLSGLMEWNLHHGHFPYYFNAREGGVGTSSGTALTLVDPQAWYYWHTGKPAYWTQLEDFTDGGIDGGEAPYGDFASWGGQFEGRYYLYAKATPRPDTTPPPAVTDLKAVPGGGLVLLKWTAPPDAARYHIVWANRAITEESTTNRQTINWWAAQAIGPAFAPRSGAVQRVVLDPGTSAVVHAALFSFDATHNMSAMSPLATTAGATPDTEAPRWTGPGRILAWTPAADPTNRATVYFQAAFTDDADPDVTVTFDPPSGSLLPAGTSVVQCTLTDFAGHSTVTNILVDVRDGTPRVAIEPAGTGVLARISLPGSCAGFDLQTTLDLAAPDSWFAPGWPLLTNDGQLLFSVPMSNPAAYFRIRSPPRLEPIHENL